MTTLIKGRYEILELIGIGGEGRVVKALDCRHGRLDRDYFFGREAVVDELIERLAPGRLVSSFC